MLKKRRNCHFVDDRRNIARIKKVYIGAVQEKTGACGSKVNLIEEYKTETKVELEFGILKNECLNLVQSFFKELRKK